jgi:ankyrin repeat protein
VINLLIWVVYIVALVKINLDVQLRIFYLFFTGEYDIIQLLLDFGIDINHKDHLGDTVLHDAVDYLDTTKSLLDCGANPHIRNNTDQTPRDLAIQRGYDDTVQILDSYMSDIKEPDVA